MSKSNDKHVFIAREEIRRGLFVLSKYIEEKCEREKKHVKNNNNRNGKPIFFFYYEYIVVETHEIWTFDILKRLLDTAKQISICIHIWHNVIELTLNDNK